MESISKFWPEDGVIVKLPPDSGRLVNSNNSNPNSGSTTGSPDVVNPDDVLSCQYFKTPVTWS